MTLLRFQTPRRPAKRRRRNHDRVAIDGLIVMDRLNICTVPSEL
jgi:hypothetical protein